MRHRFFGFLGLTLFVGMNACGGGFGLQPPDGVCGNGEVEAGELCDASDLGGATCASLNLGDGELGCDSECDICITDESVSRQHAWLDRRGSDYFLEDNNSTIATYLNGRRIVPGEVCRLMPSDELTFGTVDLIFLDAAAFFHFVRTLFAE